MTFEFLLTSLIIVASPGTGALFTVTAALSGGLRSGIIAAFGCTLGIVPHLLAAITGLAAVLHTSALAFQSLKYVGVAYLLCMAWAVFRDRRRLGLEERSQQRNAGQIILSAILANLLNPNLSIFFFAFLPQFVSVQDPSPGARMLELSLVFMALTFAVFLSYGALATGVRKHVVSNVVIQNWMRRSFAAAFAGLAGQLAFARR